MTMTNVDMINVVANDAAIRAEAASKVGIFPSSWWWFLATLGLWLSFHFAARSAVDAFQKTAHGEARTLIRSAHAKRRS